MSTFTGQTKSTTPWVNQLHGRAGETWDEANFSWDNAQGTWDDPRDIFANQTKNSTNWGNQARN